MAMKGNSMEWAKNQSFPPLFPEKKDLALNKACMGVSP
jgi:hypothetical protein